MTGPAVALTTEFDTGVPTDISTYFRNQLTINRGLAGTSVTGRIAEAGSGSVVLKNVDRRFDPTFATGPYFGKILPGVATAITATWPAVAGVTYPVIAGRARGWPQTYPQTGRDQTVKLNIADAIPWIARAKLQGFTAPPEFTGARIARALDAIGWPVGLRSISHGKTYQPRITASTGNPTNAWALMVDAANAEWGNLFIDPSGVVVFMDRKAIILNANYTTSQATFGDAPGEVKFQDVEAPFDDERILNDGKLTWNAKGRFVTATDAASKTQYGPGTWQEAAYMLQGDAQTFVNAVVRRYKDPALRFDHIVVDTSRDPTTMFPVVLSLDIGDRVTVKRTPQGGGARISRDCFINGIQHSATSRRWVTTYTLDDAEWTEDVGLLGSFNVGTIANGGSGKVCAL